MLDSDWGLAGAPPQQVSIPVMCFIRTVKGLKVGDGRNGKGRKQRIFTESVFCQRQP